MFLIDKVRDEVKEGLDPYTIELLKTTREPSHPYIVCESKHVKWSSQGREHNKAITGLSFLNLSGQVDQRYLLTDYVVNKGGRVITYGNFPTASHRPEQYKLHSEPNGSNAYDRMAHACESYLGTVVNQSSTERKLKSELKSLQEELATLKNTKENKDDTIKGANRKNAQGATGEKSSGSEENART
jgi:hypothetical protein